MTTKEEDRLPICSSASLSATRLPLVVITFLVFTVRRILTPANVPNFEQQAQVPRGTIGTKDMVCLGNAVGAGSWSPSALRSVIIKVWGSEVPVDLPWPGKII